MPDHDAKSSLRSTGPGALGSLVLMIVVAVGTLWIALFIPGALLAELVVRVPPADWKWLRRLGYAMFPTAFFLSGVVTMVFSRRSLRPASGATTALRSMALVASACVLLGVLAPCLMYAYMETGHMTELLCLQAIATFSVLWLCWVAGGLAVFLLRAPGRRQRSEHSA